MITIGLSLVLGTWQVRVVTRDSYVLSEQGRHRDRQLSALRQPEVAPARGVQVGASHLGVSRVALDQDGSATGRDGGHAGRARAPEGIDE